MPDATHVSRTKDTTKDVTFSLACKRSLFIHSIALIPSQLLPRKDPNISISNFRPCLRAMAGFPRAPEIRGDTDDDASVHLHNYVGAARPLRSLDPIRRRAYDRQARDILESETAKKSRRYDYEDAFMKYSREIAGSDEEESSSDSDTQVEELPVVRTRAKRKRAKLAIPLDEPSPLWNLRLVGLVVGIVLLLMIPLPQLSSSGNVPLDSKAERQLGAKVAFLEQRVDSIAQTASLLSLQIDRSENPILLASLDTKLNKLEFQIRKLSEVDPKVIADIEALKAQLELLEPLGQDPSELQQRFNLLSERLEEYRKMTNEIESWKAQIDNFVTAKIKEHVPLFIENKQVHYLPEFQSWLRKYINDSANEHFTKNTWNEIENMVDGFVNVKILDEMHNFTSLFVSRDEFAADLEKAFELTEKKVTSELHLVLDKFDFSNSSRIDVSRATNRIALDNLLDVISKGSLKVDFASYKLGARVLGFLTTRARIPKSAFRKLFLGWYDYLNSNGITSPQNIVYNANNAISENSRMWLCGLSSCSIGVRLLAPIILTDIVLNSGGEGGGFTPDKASIYVKPRTRKDATKLEDFLESYRQEFLAPPRNKWLKKFYKIKEVELDRNLSFIKIPISIVNLKIPIRDIYVEFSSSKGSTGLLNLRAYGLTEYNAMRLDGAFSSLLDELAKQEQSLWDLDRVESRGLGFDSSRVLGEDDIHYS